MYVIIFTNSIRSWWIEYWSVIWHNIFYEKKRKLRIADYNLQCAVCYCNDHIKIKFLLLIGRFLNKSSTLKPLGQMNRNVVGSIYGRPSIKIAHLGSVNKHGQHRQFVLLIGRFPKNFYSETAWPNEPKRGR